MIPSLRVRDTNSRPRRKDGGGVLDGMSANRRPRSILILLFGGAAAFGAAAAGSLATARGLDRYRSLNRPSWIPPEVFLGPVWTVLYALMALAARRVWTVGASPPRAVPWSCISSSSPSTPPSTE